MSRTGFTSAATHQGTRFAQEDCVLSLTLTTKDGSPAYLLAVMDGHRGDTVSKHCARRIPELIGKPDRQAAEAQLQQLIATLRKETSDNNHGSTISLALVLPQERIAWIAVLGDSPVLVTDRAGRLRMSPEHNVSTHPADKRSLTRRGVTCANGYQLLADTGRGLQLTRALGNADFGSQINRTPDIYRILLCDASVVLVCSDGVVRNVRGNTPPARELIQEAARTSSADALLLWKMNKNGRRFDDNASIVLWRYT